MIESWMVFSILASAIWAVSNVVDKYVISGLAAKPVIPTIISGIVGLLFCFGILVFRGFGPLSFTGILVALVAGILYFLVAFLYFSALKYGEVSTLVPLFFLSPLFIAFFAGIFLGEIFTPANYAGIVLLVAGAFLISWNANESLRFGKAFWLMIFSMLSLSANQLLTKCLLNFSDFWTVFAYVKMGMFLPIIPALVLNFSELVKLRKKTAALILSSEFMYNAGVLLITLAISVGSVTLVNALASFQPFFLLLFVVILGIFYPRILKEDIAKPRIFLKALATAIMFAGALLLG